MTDTAALEAAVAEVLTAAPPELDSRLLKQVLGRVVERYAAHRPTTSRPRRPAEDRPAGPPPFPLFPAPPYFSQLAPLEDLLRHGADQGVSGIHFAPGKPVTVNLHGYLRAATERHLSHDEVNAIADLLHNPRTPGQASALVLSGQPVRGAYFFRRPRQTYRFRLQMTGVEEDFIPGVHIAVRVLPPVPPSHADLGLPVRLRQALLAHAGGLIIITGPTGSGKTTLLASTLIELALARSCNILTYEDPVEFALPAVFPSGSIIHQSEIGRDVADWMEAIKTALRRELHIGMLGELLDYEVLQALLRGCLTGHLFLTTLHATGFPAALSALYEMFPHSEKRQGLGGLLHVLRLVVSQHLIPTVEGTRTAVYEYVPFNQAVRERLQDTTNVELTARNVAADYGYRFKDSLKERFEAGIISEEVYQRYLFELCEIKY